MASKVPGVKLNNGLVMPIFGLGTWKGSTADYAVIYLRPKLFAPGQAYVTLSRIKSLDGLLIEDLDISKLTGKTPCNIDALAEMHRLRQI
ncbi:unnamed protein product [Ceutorhynchus assimilis]|uniref:Uncharacterized protein n=1 Tax=Ceutorhynchus assimilis TaxID=467358 RepID=A0A9N9QNE3_9CUCU|nr:unnamed protein product [Ceutorhynchus assimilis]